MTINNYNDYIRNNIVSKYDEINILDDTNDNEEDIFLEELEKYYKKLKQQKGFKYIMGMLYSDFYTVKQSEIEGFDDEESSIIDDEIININNIDELIKLCDEDICYFYDVLSATSTFYEMDYIDKKSCIEISSKSKRKILKVFPGFLVDMIYYLNTYNKYEIFETYLEFKRIYDVELLARKDTINLTSEILLKLKDDDFYNYKFLMLEMIEDFYKYIHFLIENNLIKNEDYKKLMNLIEKDLDFFINIASNRLDILNMILKGFLDYILLSDEKLEIIDKYYEDKDNKKRYIKFLQISEKLKKNNI